MDKFFQGWGSKLILLMLIYCSSASPILALPCTLVTPCKGPFSKLSLSGCKTNTQCCGAQEERCDFCVYPDPCTTMNQNNFCEPTRIEQEIDDLRCQVEEGHMYAAVILGHKFLKGEGGVCKDNELARFWYCKAAEAGLSVAQVQMGHFYRDGCVLPHNINMAISWYQKAVKQDDIPAMLALAELYKGWHGAKPDRAKALALYQKAAALGSSEGEYQGGLLLMQSTQTKGVKQGIKQLMALAEDGHPDSIVAIGDAYYEGRLGPRDLCRAYNFWFQGAKAGSAIGAYKLGMAAFSGEYACKNPYEGASWIVLAARKGLPEAELLAGDLYREGRGVVKDMTIAAEWYCKAAEHGQWRGHLELGDLYHAGKGVPRFLEEAARRYMIASDFGNNAYASLMLSTMFEDGRGVPQDLCKNVEYYEKAKSQPGYLAAVFKVGRRYAEGYGLKKSMTLATRWYCRAADCGYTNAQVELGDLHYLGVCFPQDFGKAFEWYHKAACCGHTYAQNMLGLILLEGDCLPQYACTVVRGFRFKDKVFNKNCPQFCGRCPPDAVCKCEPAYSEKAGEGCPACLIPNCPKHMQAQCHCSPCTPCNCGARNAYRIPAWCSDVCSPKYKYCAPTPGRCTVAISKENAKRAAKWIHKAAINGAPQAQFQLGLLYMKGIGVERDEARAYAWLHTALECMEDKNPDMINCIIDLMTPEMRARAVWLADRAKCKYRHCAVQYPER